MTIEITKDDILHMAQACYTADLSCEKTKVGCRIVVSGQAEGHPPYWIPFDAFNTMTDMGHILHAEDHAFRLARHAGHEDFSGDTVYVTKFPCLDCCELLVAEKVSRLVAARPYAYHPFTHEKSRWYESQQEGLLLLREKGITVHFLDVTVGTPVPTVHPAILLAFGIDESELLPE